MSSTEVPPTLPGNVPLSEHDPDLYDLIEKEKYAEGLPSARYYGGNEIVDQIESLCQSRALEAYGLDAEEWGINVQPYSGSPANFAVYTALLKPHDRIMGLDLPSGGHLTHGFYTYSKKENTRKAVSATSVYFESLPYRVNPETGLIDYEELAKLAALFKPAMIICGGSAYPQEWDYAQFRKIADDNGALLLCDMAHISGLVVSREASSPFDYCDVVTTTTHKSLRGPRAGMIFYKLDERDFAPKINNAVFPALQGGPHEHQVAAIATQLKECMTPEFKEYSIQVKKNAAACAARLVELGYTICTGGTVNHLLLWDLRPNELTGSKMEKICDAVHITLNKNAVQGDRSAITPGGVRVGTPACTTRGMKEDEFRQIADFMDRACKIALSIQSSVGTKLKAFVAELDENEDVKALAKEVTDFARRWPMPGFEASELKYKEHTI